MKPVIKKIFFYGTGAFLIMGLLGVLAVVGLYFYLVPKLPDIDALKDVRLQVPLRVYTRKGELIAEYGEMRRQPLTYDEFPKPLIHAVLAAEDDRFFEHPGVDIRGIVRAAIELVRTGGEKRQGGSTITMQVARNFFLTREKTFIRKFNEIFLALKIERELTKEDILALYLNKIFLGNRAYGFGAAAQVYYGKPLSELTLAQTATLAGLPKAPSRFNPVVNPERAIERRGYVLHRMLELGFITQPQYDQAMNESDHASVHAQAIEVEAPYIAEMVRSEMLARYGNEAYTAGFEVYTTIDKTLQEDANQSLRDALLEYDRRHGFRGEIKHVNLPMDVEIEDTAKWEDSLGEMTTLGNLTPAIVFDIDSDDNSAYAYTTDNRVVYLPWDHINWAQRYVDDNHLGPELKKISDILKVGDVIYTAPDKDGCSWFAQVPEVSGALVSLNPDDGAINALIGGFDYNHSKFNRVTMAERQPGSSFKPFIYAAAIDKGFTAASIINDAPVVFDAPGLEDTWRPENYSGKVYGETRLRQALVHSRNLVSIRLLRDIGIGYALRYSRRFGLENAHLPRDLSLALGSGTLTPLELATGYSVFANGGYRVAPFFINYIKGPDGSIIYLKNPQRVCPECIKDQAAEKLAGDANDNDAAPPADDTAEGSQTAAPPPVEQDSLQAFLVPAGSKQTLEDSIRREVWFQEGPQPLIPAPRILSPQTDFIMDSMLRDVIRHGTGRRALTLGRNDLAGKTGTTNDQRDAWFAGFNSHLVTISWVGFDTPRPLGSHETGAIAALPMWIEFMGDALKHHPETPLVQPPGIVSVRINEKTGKPTTATDPDAMFEYFLEDQVPTTEVSPSDAQPQSQPNEITRDLF
ncbi:MAG: peptidase [Gammaproteobacteria bacterium]|nr:peptidase [Gammaproteobacteria bacterium]